MERFATFSKNATSTAASQAAARLIRKSLLNLEEYDDNERVVQGLLFDEMYAFNQGAEFVQATPQPEHGHMSPFQLWVRQRGKLLKAGATILGSLIDALGEAFLLLKGVLRSVQELVELLEGEPDPLNA